MREGSLSREHRVTTYARRLGLFSGTMAVIGGIIGGGIFRTPAAVAAQAGTPALLLAAWIVGGVVALIGACCFAELGQRRPQAGGGYIYLRDTLGPLPAFLYGWALLLVIATGAIAAVAVTFANYTLAFTRLPASLTAPIAIGAIVLLSGINYVGVHAGAVTQNVLTTLKLAALGTLIVAGFTAAGPAAASGPPAPAGSGVWSGGAFGGALALGTALVPVLFTYGGWQQTNFIAEEIVAPERNLPRALIIGVVVVVAVYLLANLAYLRALGADGMAASTAPAADVMTAAFGPAGGTAMALGVAVSALGFLNLVIMVTPRVFQAMAADGVFFPRLAVLHPRFRTPTAAILLQAGWAGVLTLTGTFGQLVNYVSFGDWIFFALTGAGLFIYRARDRQGAAGGPGSRMPGGFRVPGYPVTPLLFIAASLLVVLGAVLASPRNALLGLSLLLLGVPVYWYWSHRLRSVKP